MDNLAENIRKWLEEIDKCADSFRYFVDNYCYIENKETGEAVKFKLWPCQVKILPDILKCLLLIILKARQLGLTWLVCCYCLWRAMFKTLELIIVISAKEDWAVEFLERVKFIRIRLPEWLQPAILKDTSEQLAFSHNGLTSTIKSLPTTPSGAQSKTPTLLVIDESAENRYLKNIYAASKPGLDVAKGQLIIISNALKDRLGWPFTRRIYTGAMKGVNGFKRIFLSWWEHPGRPRDKVIDPSTNQKVYRFLLEQQNQEMDEESVSMHYPSTEEEAISVITGSYFGKVLARHTNTMEGIKGYFIKSVHGEIQFKPDPKGIVEIWRFPYHLTKSWDGIWWEDRYCIGSDVSEGLGKTYSHAFIMDRLIDEFVGQIRSNRIDAYQWAEQLNMASIYYKSTKWNALICPERDGAGITTCQRLMEIDNANLYLKQIPAKVGTPPTNIVGWSEKGETNKHDLCGQLKNWLRTMRGILYSSILIDECSTFILHDNMKLEHEEGKMDDSVIAAGCTIIASKFIGVSPKSIKPPVTGWLKKHQEGML